MSTPSTFTPLIEHGQTTDPALEEISDTLSAFVPLPESPTPTAQSFPISGADELPQSIGEVLPAPVTDRPDHPAPATAYHGLSAIVTAFVNTACNVFTAVKDSNMVKSAVNTVGTGQDYVKWAYFRAQKTMYAGGFLISTRV